MTLTNELHQNIMAIECLLFHMKREMYTPSHCRDCPNKALCMEIRAIIKVDAGVKGACRS